MTMAALAKPVPTVSEVTANMEESDSDLAAMAAQHEKLTMSMARRSLEIVVTVVAEIIDEEIFQLDCAMLWTEVFNSQAAITGVDTATKIPEFERRIRAQYQDLFQEQMGLPPTCKDGGFRIRTIPGIDSLHKSPYRLTPHEWEEYRTNTRKLISKRLICKSNTPYTSLVLSVSKGFDVEWKPMCWIVIDYRVLNKIMVKDRFLLPHPQDLLAKLQGMKPFSKLDFFSGYYHHRNHPDSIKKTAFIGPD
jgi:hypothetical protein